MRSVKTLILIVPLLSGLLLAPSASAEIWTDVTGKHRIDAKFLSVSGGNVYLEKTDGTRIKVPIKQLSPDSLTLAKRLYGEAKSGSGDAAPVSAAMPISSTSNGQSKLGANPTASETADVMSVALAEFDMVTIWDAFPKKHQDDIEELIRLGAGSIDELTWNDVSSLLKKATRLVGEKKEFFMKNQMLGSMIPQTPETDKIWDATAGVLAAYANSSITDQAAMKNFSMGQFIANDVPKMQAANEKLQALTQELQDTPFGQAQPKVEVVSESATEAMISITTNGQTQEQRFVKTENRWLPAEMVDDWDKEMEKAKAEIAKLSTPEGRQGLGQMRMVLGMAAAPVDQMLNASTQVQFDTVVNNMAGLVMGMMGGMGGPGGGPPGFGPGGPGGPPPGFGPGPGGPPPGFGGGDF